MKKRFILLIDFSAYSANLLRYAYDWSTRVHAEIVLVHQASVMAPALTDNQSRNVIAEISNKEMSDKLKSLVKKTLPADAVVSYKVSDDTLLNIVSELLNQPFDNLVFAGLKGTGLLKKIFIGSKVLEIIEYANTLVVAMPKVVSKYNPGKIYVAVSEQNSININALYKAIEFIGSGIELITFFYHAKPGEEKELMESELNKLSSLFSKKYKTQCIIYDEENPITNIKDVINDTIEELLIIQKGSRMFTDQLFRKFLVNELVYEGQTPMIILP